VIDLGDRPIDCLKRQAVYPNFESWFYEFVTRSQLCPNSVVAKISQPISHHYSDLNQLQCNVTQPGAHSSALIVCFRRCQQLPMQTTRIELILWRFCCLKPAQTKFIRVMALCENYILMTNRNIYRVW